MLSPPDNEETAYSAARAVTASYSDVKPPVLNIDDAIKQGMVFPKQADDIVVGDAEGSLVLGNMNTVFYKYFSKSFCIYNKRNSIQNL